MRRRSLPIVGVAAVLVIGAGVAWRSIPYVPPPAEHARATSVVRELGYVARYWRVHNPEFGDFGGTDCVNFTSQALLARGWPMSADWGTSDVLGRRAATRTWVSSTAMMRWLGSRPDLATALDDRDRAAVAVGDIAQFDWDSSGDRDHTAVVSRIRHDADGRIEIDVAEHSPSGLHDSVDSLIAAHGGRGTVHYWHLRT